jgi:DNA-directed RNA polymerase beta subunit
VFILFPTAGYSYYGTEKLYSGIDGREMDADIFFGVVHYQRLRHMVSDKFQVCRWSFNLEILLYNINLHNST